MTDKNTKTPGKTADPVATQAELVKSNKVLERALKNFEKDTEIPDIELPTIRELRRNIDVEILPATNILRLVYHYPDPQIAAELLNSIAKSAVKENIRTNQSQASTLREFLEAKITEQQSRLQRAEIAESEYRQTQGLVNFEAQSKSLVNSLTKLQNEELDLSGQLQRVTTKREMLKQAAGMDNIDKAHAALRLSEDKQLLKLRSQLEELEAEINRRRSYLTDNAPELQTLLSEQKNLRASIDKKAPLSNSASSNPYSRDLISQYVSIQIEHKTLENRLKTVKAEKNNLQTQVAQLPAYQKSLAKLIRRQETVEASLKLLQSKLEEAKIAETQSSSTTRIVSDAEINTIPVSPKPAVVLVLGTAAGILISIGAVFCLGLIDDNGDDAADAKETLNLPILGVLPNLTTCITGAPDLYRFLDDSTLVEPYRALLKTLESSSNGKTPSVVISSIVSGEGKSSVALHLSAVAAMLSRRTLIIDADLRQPMQHELLDVSPYPGLTEVLENPKIFLSVARTTMINNLSVITHGQLNNRPAASIESKSMEILLEAVEQFYDLVIIDASSTSICADAGTLSELTDGLVLTVRPNFISKEMIMREIAKLKESNVSILGVVINEIGKNKNHYLSSNQGDTTKFFKYSDNSNNNSNNSTANIF
ncbi:MAG: polysaccharide biosynthesis tyrosine autokinase [Waterburya sp.]